MSESFVSQLVSKLNLGSKANVCISVTPSMGIEMIQMDHVNNVVKTYTSRPLSYNDSLREIASLDEFKSALTSMFEELNINPKCNVSLNLPMVLFGSIELSLLLGDDAITGAITSEVEQSYIFKRHDPIVSWMDASGGGGENRKLLYTAVQQLVIDNLKNALSELGANLVSVEMSLASTLRALSFTGLAEKQMQEGITWNLLMVTNTGYSLVSMVGKHIVDYYEEPLAIKSFEGDEIYNAINASAQITLMSYPANYLLLVSDSDAVSAEILSKKLNVEYSVDYVENNHFKRKPFIETSLDVLPDNVQKISLQAIGVSVSRNSDYPINFNFLSSSSSSDFSSLEESVKFRLGDKDVELTPSAGRNLSLIFAALLIVPFLAAYLLLPTVQSKKQLQLDELNASIELIDKEIKDLETAQAKAGTFDIKTEINTVMKNNRSKLMTYSAIGSSVPSKLWLTYFMTQADGQVDIKGVSNSVEDVSLFFRNLKDSLAGNSLKLHKLEMQSGSVDDVVTSGSSAQYEFEITNMTASQLNPQAAVTDPSDPNAPPPPEGQAKDANANNSLLGQQPLPNIGKK